ncbi:phosphorylase kinase, gamma catalytic subunit [Artemisia annua]|uniref:Phosphorylase kinase, gamma catalytic subunit n=1 Tax=Artemisia annua TaxID=35608 RepID=A0A2U1KXB5_ARTAN|nr:phosphorylase kinase, gamma catalytic subunit [Artemisia annua]
MEHITNAMEKYQLLESLGHGSFGVVFKAFNKQTHEVVAIKKLMTKYCSKEECMNLTEVKSLVKMHNNHANIIRLKEVINLNDTLFLVFEYMECNLYQRMIQHEKPFSETEIRNICFQVFQGLAYMHHNGYFHRDLKPENLLINKDIVKIADLGQAREMNAQRPFTYNVTTICYRAPEVFLHSPVYNSAVDMWAMGAIIVELFTLTPIFEGSSEADVIYKICSVLGTPTDSTWPGGLGLAKNMCYRFPDLPGVRFSDLLPNASPELVNLVATLLSWEPSYRPTAIQALQHPFFHSCYFIPPTVRLQDTSFTLLDSVPLVFKMAMLRELMKKTPSFKSCASSLERVDFNEDLSHFLPKDLFV